MTAKVLNDRILKSEQSYVGMLNMIYNLFLEPVVPLSDDVRPVFANVEQICDAHALMWRSLEPLLDESADLPAEDILEKVCMELYRYSSLWTVYISFLISHDTAQNNLKTLLGRSSKFSLLAKDAASLRPGSSLSSMLQLIRVRPFQMRRYLLHASSLLRAKDKDLYGRGIFAARGTVRMLLQLMEIWKLEMQQQDADVVREVQTLVPKLQGFFPATMSVLWKGVVRVGLEPDCRMVVCADRMLLVKKMSSFWSGPYYDLVGVWKADARLQHKLATNLFSATEVSSDGVQSAPLYGVHISGSGSGSSASGVDWRVILPDKLATTALVSCLKEMMTECDQECGRLDKVSLAMEEPDRWHLERDGPEPQREFSGHSPEELRDMLRELRLQYEKDGAIVIENDITRLYRQVGKDKLLGLLSPLLPHLPAALTSSSSGSSAASSSVGDVHIVVARLCSSCGSDNESAWQAAWRISMADALTKATPDTLLRDNGHIVMFTTKYLSYYGLPYVKKLVADLRESDAGSLTDQCRTMVECILKRLKVPLRVLEMLHMVRELVEANEKLAPFVGRALSALFFLRLIGPLLIQATDLTNNIALAKFLVNMSNKSHVPDSPLNVIVDEFYDQVQTFLLSLDRQVLTQSDAFANESFIDDPDAESTTESHIMFLLDRIVSNKAEVEEKLRSLSSNNPVVDKLFELLNFFLQPENKN